MQKIYGQKQQKYADTEAKDIWTGIGCGTVGIAVASDSRGPWFESSHRQNFILNIYCQLNRKDEGPDIEAKDKWKDRVERCREREREAETSFVVKFGVGNWSVRNDAAATAGFVHLTNSVTRTGEFLYFGQL